MTEEELIERHPRLYHMATDGSWPSIKRNGLLSVTALLDLYGVAGQARAAIESARRPECVTLKAKGLPDAVIRDNKPMSDEALVKCLEGGLAPKDWYEILNWKSFFWAERERVEKLLGARAYKKDAHAVITVDTASVVGAYREQVRLARINTGATLYVPQPRGAGTFKRIEEFPTDGKRIGTKTRPKVVELVVEGGVPDVSKYVIEVHRVKGGTWAKVPL